MEYYTFDTEQKAIDCITFINATPWFPIIGKINGIESPDSAKTTCWCEEPLEMLNGNWAVPKIPQTRLEALNVPQVTRDDFISAFGQDIRELSSLDFPVIEDVI